MNSVLRKIVEKVLLIPCVEWCCRRIYQFCNQFYGIRGFATHWYAIPWLEKDLNVEKLDLEGGGFNESDAKALAKVVQIVVKDQF